MCQHKLWAQGFRDFKSEVVRNGAPKKAEEPYPWPFVSNRRKMAQPVPTMAFLYLAKSAAMCTTSSAEIHHLPLSHLFLLAQTLSSKWIATHLIQPSLMSTNFPNRGGGGGGGQVHICGQSVWQTRGVWGHASLGILILDLLLDTIWWNRELFLHKHNLPFIVSLKLL